jgi:hypothetical protein
VATIFRRCGGDNGRNIAEYALMLAVILVFGLGAIWLIVWIGK